MEEWKGYLKNPHVQFSSFFFQTRSSHPSPNPGAF